MGDLNVLSVLLMEKLGIYAIGFIDFHAQKYHQQRENEEQLQYRLCLLFQFSQQTRLESISSEVEIHIQFWSKISSIVTTPALQACKLAEP